MSWITNLLSGGAGELVGKIGGIVDEFHMSGEEKEGLKMQMEELLQKRDAEIEATIRTELQAKERVLVAELTQDDKFVKRARPLVVYAGLGFILINYCIIPSIQSITGAIVEPFALPTEFWVGWSGIVATWSIGRSAEKRGARGRAVSVITGTKFVED